MEKAFPAIITKAQFNRVGKLMRARAPKRSHPRRVGSTYLLSGLVKCKACGRALSGQDAKSGQFSYYVCQSIMKRGKNACVTPRLNARRFEQMIVDKIPIIQSTPKTSVLVGSRFGCSERERSHLLALSARQTNKLAPNDQV